MKKNLTISGTILVIIIFVTSIVIKLTPNYSMFSPASQNYIDHMIKNEMHDGHIPGLSVLIVKHNKVILDKGYGYANIKKKIKVSPKTRFEIASNTKTFTGYVIMQLVKDGKIQLNEKVSHYIPGFYMTYNGHKQGITVDQLVAQTSGIPADITDNDKITQSNNSLEGIVNSVKGRHLNAKPGKNFEYSNMNYDILGLIVQEVSHESYASYIKDHIFKPLNMKHVTTKESNNKIAKDAQGYDIQGTKAYVSRPEFNVGDTSSAYMMAGTKDLESWIRFQLNPPSYLNTMVEATHQAKVKTESGKNATEYATGWFIDHSTGEKLVYHPGTLENYSSYIILNPKKDYGIVVLANAYSKNVFQLAHNLNIQMSNGKHVTTMQHLINQWQPYIVALTIIIWILIISVLRLVYRYTARIAQLQFTLTSPNVKLNIVMLSIAFILILGLLHLLPSLILSGSDWYFMMSWLPVSAKVALLSLIIFLMSCFAFLFLKLSTANIKTK